MKYFSLFFITMVSVSNVRSEPVNMIVTARVADLRSKPIAAPVSLQAPALSRDIGAQDSQLLMGDRIKAEPADEKGWLKVEVLDQPVCKNSVWSGYPGYIKAGQAKEIRSFPSYNLVVAVAWANVYESEKDNTVILPLSLGTKLVGKKSSSGWWAVRLADGRLGMIAAQDVRDISGALDDINTIRERFMGGAIQLLFVPYVWGGCSAHDTDSKTQITGSDCSGTVYLAFASQGLQVARDAHDQYLQSLPVVSGIEMKVGDLVFTLPVTSTSGRMTHVYIYLGEGELIETTGLGFSSKNDTKNPEELTTRIIRDTDAFGCSMHDMRTGQRVCNGTKYAHLRTFFGSQEQLQELRNKFLRV